MKITVNSDAFSSGSYDGDPYILMNYKADAPQRCLHPGPRGWPLDAQLPVRESISRTHTTATRSSWPKSEHVQSRTRRPPSSRHARDNRDRTYPALIGKSTPSAARSSARRCLPNSRSRSTPRASPGEPLTIRRLQRALPRAFAAVFRS